MKGVIGKIVRFSVKNLQRKRSRTILLGGALFLLSLLSVVFVGYSQGIYRQMVETAMKGYVGQRVVYAARSKEDILWPEHLESFSLEGLQGALTGSFRLDYRSQAFVYTGTKQAPVLLVGTTPMITNALWVKEGSLDGVAGNAIWLTPSLASDLGVHVGESVRVEVRTVEGFPNVDYFEVRGVVTPRGMSELMAGHFAFVPIEAMRVLKHDRADAVTEVVFFDRRELPLEEKVMEASGLASLAGEKYGGLLLSIATGISAIVFVVLGITMVTVLIFLFDTMLTVVEERKREFGIMMSMGLSSFQIAMTLIAEVVMQSLLFVLPGVVLGGLVVAGMGVVGIPVKAKAMAVIMGGYERLYPVVSVPVVVMLYLGITLIMIMTSTYAIVKAISLDPQEVLRNE